MIEEGPGAVSARKIALTAGVPVASITYYFDSVAAIMGEALVSGIEQRNAQFLEAMRRALRARQTRGTGLEALARLLSNRDPRLVALRYELYGIAYRTEELAESIEAVQGLIFQGIQRTIEILGISAEATAAFEVMLEGFATANLTAPLPKDEEIARTVDAMRRLVLSDLPEGMTMAEWDALPLIITKTK